MCHCTLTKYITLFAVFEFQNEYFSPTNFAENLKVSLSMNTILLNLKEIFVNTWTLQNYGDLFAVGLLKELCALECRKLHAKCEKKTQTFILPCFFHLDGKKCIHKLKYSVLQCKRFIFSSPV